MCDDSIKRFDVLLDPGEGPAALVLRDHLIPVEGADGVLFPATFAPGGALREGGYNIDVFPDGTNVCLVDSVGSQANRLEPIFARTEYSALVPQIFVQAGQRKVSLLEAGHRAGDALVRCSELQETLEIAFKAVLRGDALLLAKIAPTSIVFGVWDSRKTQAKLPRLIMSTIRAFNVRKLTRSAQFIPAVDYATEGILDEPEDLRDADGKVKTKHPFAQRGFTHVPASGSHGGVVAIGGIRRDSTLQLAALRLLAASTEQETVSLRRYILGLALTALTYPEVGYLRQGCNLVLDSRTPREFVEVYGDGRRVPIAITHHDAKTYAHAVAAEFGVEKGRIVSFSPDLARADLAEADGGGSKPRKTRRGKAG